MLALLFLGINLLGFFVYGYYPSDLTIEEESLIQSKPEEYPVPVNYGTTQNLLGKASDGDGGGNIDSHQTVTNIIRTCTGDISNGFVCNTRRNDVNVSQPPKENCTNPSETNGDEMHELNVKAKNWSIGQVCAEKKGEAARKETISEAPQSIWKTLKDPVYISLAIPCITVIGFVPVHVNNMVVFLESFNMMQHAWFVIYIGPFSSLIFRIVIGFISDLLVDYMPRGTMILLHIIIAIPVYIASAVHLGNILVISLSAIVVMLGTSIMFGLMPVILGEECGIQTLSRDWGIILAATGVACFLFQYLFGVFYDLAREGDVICYGQYCFVVIFTIATLIFILDLAMIVWYLKCRRTNLRRTTFINRDWLRLEHE